MKNCDRIGCPYYGAVCRKRDELIKRFDLRIEKKNKREKRELKFTEIGAKRYEI